MSEKLGWSGAVIAVQPRIRLTRSFDERSHSYLGYVLHVDGAVGERTGQFWVGIGKGAQTKHAFRAGDEVSGKCAPVADPRREAVEFYRVSGLQLGARGPECGGPPPPWTGLPPELETYRKRGHRRLSSRTYKATCGPCLWACRMPVDIIIDHWDPSRKRHRFETFCYGPKSCRLYKAGPKRRVPGRHGMVWVDEDWVDEDAVAHRGEDE